MPNLRCVTRQPIILAAAATAILTVPPMSGLARADSEPGTPSVGIRILTTGPTTKAMPGADAAATGEVSSPNPWLSWLPEGVEPDYEGWRPILEEKAAQRAKSLKKIEQASGLANVTINQSEAEPAGSKGLNDTIGTAEAIGGFGTGDGGDPAADVDGNLRAPNPPSTVTPNAEDDGNINAATVTSLADDAAVIASATIGDGPFGGAQLGSLQFVNNDVEDDSSISLANPTGLTRYDRLSEAGTIGDGPAGSSGTGTGDWDFYSFTVDGRDIVTFDLTATTAGFRPLLAIYRNDGLLFEVFDDLFVEGQITLTAEFTTQGGPADFYVAVGGNTNPGGNPANEVLSDPFDGTTGVGTSASSEGNYNIIFENTPPGDFDVYEITAVAGDYFTAEVDTDPYGGNLDPIVAVYDSTGNLIVFNDDGVGSGSQPFDSLLAFVAPISGDYYLFVGGFSFFPTSPDSFPEDAFDSASGPGFGSEGDYDLIVSRNNLDIDIYSFEVDAGDVIGLNMFGSARFIDLLDPAGNTLVGSASDSSGIYPSASLLPGGGVASSAYVVPQSGTHYALIFGGDGAYSFQVRGFRPPQEASATKQTIFVDFDGATLDTRIFSSNGFENATLSPLVDFLPGWGLTSGDESAVIDAILAETERSLREDIAANGFNPDYEVEILNSRDHTDPFGDPNVSRVIVGGTIAESGVSTIGIAQSIDPGNFDTTETALVLLDLLSAPASDPNSLNQYPLTGGATIIDLIGAGVGNIVAHEAGHFLANFHTDNSNILPNIMDTGGNLANLVGVGFDGIFGSGDDIDVVFEADTYDPFEGFIGVEDTKNAIAWALFGATSSGNCSGGSLPSICALPDLNGNDAPEIAVVRVDAGDTHVLIRDGSTDAQLVNTNLGSDTTINVVAMPDIQSNGSPELAFLRELGNGQVYVRLIDANTGVGIRSVFYGAQYGATQLQVVDDYNGSGTPELAVMGSDGSDAIRVQVRESNDGSFLDNIFLGTQGIGQHFVPIADISGNSVPEMGILSVLKGSDQVRMQVWDTADAVFQDNVWFGKVYQPVRLVSLPDINGNGSEEVVGMGVDPATQNIRVQVRDTDTTAILGNIFLGAVNTAIDIAVINDTNGNGFPDLAILLETPGGTGRVRIQDSSTGAFIRNLFFSAVESPQGIAVLEDYNGNGFQELAAVGTISGNTSVIVLDTSTGGQLNRVDYP